MTRRPDPRIPAAYNGKAADLFARVHPELRKNISEKSEGVCYGALFLGPTGCGKSSAAAWAIRRWAKWLRSKDRDDGDATPYHVAERRVAWLDAFELTDAERRYRLGSGEPEELTSAYRAGWLVFDDVGFATSADLVQLVLGRRYRDCLPSIVTSGLTKQQLTDHIGAQTVRRIVEYQGAAGLLVDCHDQELLSA